MLIKNLKIIFFSLQIVTIGSFLQADNARIDNFKEVSEQRLTPIIRKDSDNLSEKNMISALIKTNINSPELKISTQKTFKSTKTEKSKPSLQVETYFSPSLSEDTITCTEKIIELINGANKTILIQAYSFTSAPIIQALLNALKRGVRICLIIDRSYALKDAAQNLAAHRATVRVDFIRRGIAHNKIMIIDNKEVITGSFNFTNAAEKRNTENIVILRGKHEIKRYRTNFLTRVIESVPLKEHQRRKQNIHQLKENKRNQINNRRYKDERTEQRDKHKRIETEKEYVRSNQQKSNHVKKKQQN